MMVFLIASLLITPTFKIPGFIGLRIDDLIVFSLLLFFLLSASFAQIRVKVPQRAVLLILFSFLLVLSIGWGSQYDLSTSLGDLTKFIWLIKILVLYIFIFTFIFSDAKTEKEVNVRRNYVLNKIVVYGAISGLICLAQYINLFNLNGLYLPFIAGVHANTLIEGYASPRVVGMIGNPNAQGYLMALCLITATYLQLINFSKLRLLLILTILTALFLTLSRTSLVVLFIGIFILFLGYSADKKFFLKKVIFISVFFAILILLYFFLKNNETIYKLVLWRFETLENVKNDESMLARFHAWTINIHYFLKSPIIGVGPVPRGTNIFGSADNEWLLFARSYGVLGIIWLLCFFLLPFFQRSKFNGVLEKNHSVFNLAIIVATIAYMIPAAVITNNGLNGLLIVILALKDNNYYSLNNKW